MSAIIIITLLLVGWTLCIPATTQNEEEADGIPDGYELVQGDILVDKRTARNANIIVRKWENGIVPYTFDSASNFTQQEKDLILSAMAKMSQDTNNCIRFTPRTTEVGYIVFNAQLRGCFSMVGNRVRPQIVSIQRRINGKGCMRQGIIIHELLHVIGFHHG